ncbi:RNA polymerase sigma factor FliA [Sulfurospirillum diekertiae]|jgi:RNA polymerase sigma factor for flagellar operon FliA|uniref:RNA polymerase sigma factor FliA n=1 Tax=Sulfurospirillum diekertiae TaxID=1854492 RepID=A0A290HAN0_9BACT|nr:RNA polymerase sigma factor FliA [Sulfurospirillum diekertiae]ATB68475.1 RNA polymerase sigma factor for flagellar operon [Sulfurospirillum diekertiae]QIR76330.1 RNA polymerase sigma factor FliA [Sulfurospirillum diekertiae]QIR78960.1 RNA polymerase sigma factor FliA [Sulfurospirillum diekertiae]
MNPTVKKQPNPYSQNLKKEQDELVLQYLPAVRAMAYRLRERLPASVDVNDLISIGTEEMIKLSRRYDKDQNDSFWGYGKKRVYGSMLDFLRSLDTMSRANRRLIKMVDNEITAYLSEHGNEPDDAYLAKALNEDIEKIAEARNSSMIVSVMSLNEQITILSGEDTAQKVEKDELMEMIQSILLTFGEREQMIIQLYYFEELNLKEISEVLDISESRISQIHKKLLAKIKEQLGINHG